MKNAIEVQGLQRSFGKLKALDGLELSIPRGRVVGLLGLNGAGKTTAMRVLTGLIRADKGEVRVLGEDPWTMPPQTRRRIGYLPETGFPFPQCDLAWAAAFTSRFFPRWDAEYLQSLAEDLSIPARRPYADLSRGQQRKFSLALILARRPELLLLDDPGQGLDVTVRRSFIDGILPLLQEGETTVVFSSHVMSDVERLADVIAVVHRGRTLLCEELDAMKERIRQVIVEGESEPACGRVLRRRRAGHETCWTVQDPDERALDELRARGLVVQVRTLPFEDIFIDLVEGAEEGGVESGAA